MKPKTQDSPAAICGTPNARTVKEEPRDIMSQRLGRKQSAMICEKPTMKSVVCKSQEKQPWFWQKWVDAVKAMIWGEKPDPVCEKRAKENKTTAPKKTNGIERRMKLVKRLGDNKIGDKKKLGGDKSDGKKKFGDPKPSASNKSWWAKLTEAAKNYIWGSKR